MITLYKAMNKLELEEEAKKRRKEILDLAVEYKLSHIASALSIVELTIFLYEYILTSDDKFILSKGHGCLSLYTALRHKGLNPKLSGHPDIDRIEGIECTTGSLGHGLPMAVGMALARKITNKPGRIFVLISDGECQEGTTWESLLIAAQHKLDNLVVMVDYNKLQALDQIDNIVSLRDLRTKFEAFGCAVIIIDGHNFSDVSGALGLKHVAQPFVIVAHTTKGKGISFMENRPEWHNRIPEGDLLRQAYEELK